MSFRNEIYEYIKSGESRSQYLGLEMEHFVIDLEGVPMSFGEITYLIEKVGGETGARITYVEGYAVGYYNGRYAISIEPSCQFEVSIDPYPDLYSIELAYSDFYVLWASVFIERGYRMVAKGLLPLVESGVINPDMLPLTPRERYKLMDAHFRKSGSFGKYMMRATCAAQVSLDFCSEQDLIRKVHVLQKIAPILMIMMENKTWDDTVLPGAPDKPHLLRTQIWDDLDPQRTGYFPSSLDTGFGYQKIADVIYSLPLILLTDRGVTTDVGGKSAEDLEKENLLSLESLDEERKKKLVEHFISMSFFNLRIKKYIEVRVADSVPISKALGYAALLKGIAYSESNMDALEKELSAVDEIDKIREAVIQIEKRGREAVVYRTRTAAEWISYLKRLAVEALPENEKEYIEYL